MDAEYLTPTHRAAVERQAHVLRTIGGYGWFAAGRLAAEERQRSWMDEAERARQLRHARPRSAGRAPVLALRKAIGSVLIRAGERLRGADAAPSRRVAHGA